LLVFIVRKRACNASKGVCIMTPSIAAHHFALYCALYMADYFISGQCGYARASQERS
jgi:hypothetical protein